MSPLELVKQKDNEKQQGEGGENWADIVYGWPRKFKMTICKSIKKIEKYVL